MGSNVSCAIALATAYVTYLFSRLCVADSDLRLLGKGKPPKDAFRDKVIWITGASQGLGRMLTLYLAQQGAILILSSRSEEKLQRVKKECQVSNERVVVLPFDVCGDDDHVKAAVEKASNSFEGRGIDFLIHMAGASQHAIASETSPEVSRALLELNGLAPIRLTRLALPHLLHAPNTGSKIASKSRVVLVGSMAAKVPSPGQSSYSAAKMAAYGYFATLAAELADTRVGVTIVLPGPVASPEPTRTVYGANGLREIMADPTAKGRLSADRAVERIAAAIAHGVDEAWVAKNPVLAMAYLQQYVPSVAALVLRRIGPKRSRDLQEGRNGYDPSALLATNKDKNGPAQEDDQGNDQGKGDA